MIWLWEIPDDYPEYAIGSYQTDVSPDRFLFRQCRPMPKDSPRPVVRFDCDIETLNAIGCLANSSQIPLVNEEIAELLLAEVENEIEFVPADVVCASTTVRGYRFVNVLTCVAAINKQESAFKLVPGTEKILSFDRLVLNDNALDGHLVARNSDYRSHLLVADALKVRLDKLGFVGLAFNEPH